MGRTAARRSILGIDIAPAPAARLGGVVRGILGLLVGVLSGLSASAVSVLEIGVESSARERREAGPGRARTAARHRRR